MVLSDVYFGEGWACWSFIASQRFIVEMEMETYFFSWLIDLYGLNILAYCILSWFCYHASHNGSGKWVIPPIWVSFHFFGDFPLNHDFGRKGSTVVLTLISNAFFSRLFHHPPQSFRETRFAKFKAYSMLIFHHFIGPRTKNPTNKRSHFFFPHVMSKHKKNTHDAWEARQLKPRTFRCDYLLKASSDQIFFQRKRWSISCWKWLDLLVQTRCFGILGPNMGLF